MVNCSNEYPFTDAVYEEISGDTPIIVSLAVACFLTFACICIFLEEVVFLLNHHHDATSQINSKLVLMSLFPVISTLALIAVLVPRSTILVDLLASCYLSVCVYVFVSMTINFFGGDVAMVREFKDERVKLNTGPCCCCCCCILKPMLLTRSSLRKVKLCTLQVIIIRPVLLFVAAVLWTDGKYPENFSFTNGYSYITLVSSISTLFSIYGMLVIFQASRAKLQHYSLTLKWLPVQLCFVVVNLQSFILNALAERDIPGCNGSRGPRVRVAAINHSLLTVEMLLLAILARRGYRRIENKGPIDVTSINTKETGGIDNPAADTYGSFTNL